MKKRKENRRNPRLPNAIISYSHSFFFFFGPMALMTRGSEWNKNAAWDLEELFLLYFWYFRTTLTSRVKSQSLRLSRFSSLKSNLTVAYPSSLIFSFFSFSWLSETPLPDHGSVCGGSAPGAGEEQGLPPFQERRLPFQRKFEKSLQGY